MMDARRLIRGLALQILYELDTTNHKREDILQFHSQDDPQQYDVHLLAYLALRAYHENYMHTGPRTAFLLKLNIPIERRTPIQQILIDSLTEGVAEETLTDEHIAEIEHEITQPDVEEFDLTLKSPDELLTLPDQRSLHKLVKGIIINREVLDGVIHEYAPEWPVDQMATIDRNVLRIAIYEYGIGRKTPLTVAIAEATELAKIYGADSSGRFVNGVLGALSEHSREVRSVLKARLKAIRQAEKERA